MLVQIMQYLSNSIIGSYDHHLLTYFSKSVCGTLTGTSPSIAASSFTSLNIGCMAPTACMGTTCAVTRSAIFNLV